VIFRPLPVEGAYLVEIEEISDHRGSFGRSYCRRSFVERGLEDVSEQCNVSYNRLAGTLRGLHGTRPGFPEAKLVRCTAGAIFDVVADARPGSPTYGTWFGAELSAVNRRMLYAPPGCVHGFLTLVDGAEVFYQMSSAFVAEAAMGVAWNDPNLAIVWPGAPKVISERDAALPRLAELAASPR
jgi:dTDP-4-dehydrorhamnose 3,5-epimerase